MQITSISVIGAGPLGREIAYLAAHAGYAIVLEDVNSETIGRALSAIREWLDASDLSASERVAVLARISTSRSIEDAMRAAELIIDTTIDELETKLEVFTIFDKFACPGAMLGCCTSSLSVSDLATITLRAERCVGFRFAEFGGRLARLEIAQSSGSKREVVDAVVEVARRMRLEVAVVFDAFGAA